MPAARCSTCAVNFDVGLAGAKCPVCQEENLWVIQLSGPDDPEELRALVNNANFVRHYIKTRGHHPDEEPINA